MLKYINIGTPRGAFILNQQRIKLAKLIQDNINSLSRSYGYKTKTTGGISYQEKPLGELEESAHKVLEALSNILLNDHYSQMNVFVSYITRKRFEEGFSFDEVVQAFLISKQIILSLIKKEALDEVSYLTIEINNVVEQFILEVAKTFNLCIKESLSNKVKFLTTLYETSLACTSKIKIEDIIDVAYQKLNDFLSMDSFYFALCDENCSKINFVSMIDQGDVLPKFSIDMDENVNTLTGWVLKNRKPLLIKHMEKEILPVGFIKMGNPPDPLSILTVPLIIKDRVLGVISLQSFKPYAYNEVDLELLQSVAGNIALAVENANLHEKAHEASITDYLTGLKNRLYFTRSLGSEISRVNRYQSKFTILFGDIDNFKYYNDLLGYTKGDEILKNVARALSENIRESDVLSRFGGDEFAILLPTTNKEYSTHLITRLGLSLSRCDPPITISWGVLCYPDDASDKDDLISLADTFLKAQKGR
ncbi:MAG: Phytochrome-like protein cph2 [candidate division WS2 bacterium]|nr:Phytochrome-like protein cph2 [Candidatus Psychracetigena formicireducens]